MQQVKKLAIIISHPIQYYAPVFQLLAKEIDLKVFYTDGEQSVGKFDNGFEKEIEWDIPLLEGYEYEFLKNVSNAIGKQSFWSIKNPSAIEKINFFNPDLILVYGWSYSSHLKIMRYYKTKIPIYFRGDSTLIDEKNGFKSIIRKMLLSWVYKNIDKALFVGSANKDYFRYVGLEKHQLFFVPHSVDNNRFAEDRTSEALVLRKSFGLGDEDILILFAGKLEAKKNPELLLQAYLKLNMPNVHLLFVGNGHLEKKLKQEALRQAQGDKFLKIHFMDFQNQTQMPVIYQACDLFCLPSKGPGETWGMAVNEAMAAGKAILVSNKVGCAIDLVKSGINGDIFDAFDMDNLYQKLTHTCADKNLLLSYGNASKTIIYEWRNEKQVKSILQLINNEPKK